MMFATELQPFFYYLCNKEEKKDMAAEEKEEEGLKAWQLWLSAGLLTTGLVASWVGVSGFAHPVVAFVWYVVAYLPVGVPVIKEAVEWALKGDVFSEFMLMTIASVGAFCIGEYPEAVGVMLLYCVGEMLQDRAADRAREHIRSLVAFKPEEAVVMEDGQRVKKCPEEVAVGNTIEVKAGERVPLDGVLLTADASFNTAALTGESVPRLIETGREVLAGMIATDSLVRLRVVRPAGESAVSRILKMVEEAQERKAPTELFIRKFARIYTPIVIALATLTVVLPWVVSMVDGMADYAFATWFHRALVFLVISCPCALVVSVPLSYFAGIGTGSKRGILFKGSNSLDAMTEVDAVVFDKTGTLTTGTFSIRQIEGLTPAELDVVAAIEQQSNHPIARVIAAVGNGDVEVTVKDVPGYGLTAEANGSRWLVGTLRLLEREAVDYPRALTDIAETLIACACDGIYRGHIILSDQPKDDAPRAIKQLRGLGLSHIHILSGDKQALVEEVAADLGIGNSYGNLLPADKVAYIESLKKQGLRVAFVGDGINDAPVLALSHVGVAMGGLGADMAIETADVIIQTDQPSKVSEAIAISRRTRRIVYQNIVFAIGVKVLVMLLGLFGLANLWGAVFADTGVALLCVLNAMRVMQTPRN